MTSGILVYMDRNEVATSCLSKLFHIATLV
jgi:hypothetical protein